MMRYKTIVINDLERIGIALNAVKIGMDNRNIDEREVYENIKIAIAHLENATEKVELEPDVNT